MDISDNFYFLLTPFLIGVTYFSAFENGKTTCKRFTTNYFLYLLTTISIYLSSIKYYEKENFPIDNKYRLALIIVEIILIFSLSFVKNKTLQHLIFLAIILIAGYIQRSFLEKFKINKEVIEDVLKKMLVIILICFAISVKFPQYMNNSFLSFLIFGAIFVLLFRLIDYVFLNKKYNSLLTSLTIFIFSGFIMYDTNRVIEMGKKCKSGGNPDYLDMVFDMFLNLEGLFTNLAIGEKDE